MIKKCAGFDMNILCYDPAYQNHEYIKAIQETKDLRHARGISREQELDQVRDSGGRTRPAPTLSAFMFRCCGKARAQPLPIISSTRNPAQDEAHRISGEYFTRAGRGRSCAGESAEGKLDRWRGTGCL